MRNLAAFLGEAFAAQQELDDVRAMHRSETDRLFSVLASEDGRYLGQVGLRRRIAYTVHNHHKKGVGKQKHCLVTACFASDCG